MTSKKQIEKIFKHICSLLPKKILPSVSEWAEENRVLTGKVAAKSGKFSYEFAPYLKEIADRFAKNDPAREIAMMKGVQLCFTEAVFLSAIGYSIEFDPCAMMMVSADKELLKGFKKIRIDSLIDNSGLRDRVLAETGNKKTKRQGDTSTMIEFIGGFLKLAGSHNGADLRSFSIRKLFLDEIDGYPKEIKGEGSPIDLAVKRTETFGAAKKIGYISTPTMSHQSNIKEYFEKGDKRKYFVPCPFCNQKQEFYFYKKDGGDYSIKKGINKDGIITRPYGLLFNSEECKSGDYSSVIYRCKYCGEDIKEHHKREMLLKGEWLATGKSCIPYFYSYHISALYSPVKTWWECVKDFLDAGSDPKKLQVFHNMVLGLPFEDKTAGVDITIVHKLREEKRINNEIPDECLFLVGACDVQDDRLEVEIKGYGDRWRSWGIDHRIIYGNTSDPNDECWQILADIRDENWDGMNCNLILLDSGDGEKTDLIYRFCEGLDDRVILPCKGFNASIRSKSKFKFLDLENYNLQLVEIYVDLYKNQISRYFNAEWRDGEDYPDGWTTFASGYSDEYLRQLTTEKKVKEKTRGGLTTIKWVQHGRNEAFDLNVYCLCCAEVLLNSYLGDDFQSVSDIFDYLKNLKNKKEAGE